jgi:hypothetical protein
MIRTTHPPLVGLVFAAALAAVVVTSAGAGTIRGTRRNDVLRGSAAADKLYGNAGNDKLFGLAGNDYLSGGPGNDVLTGGPGADTLVCGPGRDTAIADARDRLGADCETVLGLPKPTVSVSGDSVSESDDGTQAVFEVTLASPTPLRVSVAYSTANGTATAESDYTPTSGTLVFGPGQTSKSVVVPVRGDTEFEPDETFTLTLSNPVNATIGTATATGTITNDDAATANPGHYNGPISSSGNIDFDVTSDGRGVTTFTLLFYMSCDDGRAGLFTLQYFNTVAIRPDLTFDASFSGTNSHGDTYTIGLTGKFDNAANNASGTLNVHYTFAGGSPSCDTGAATWTAPRQ